MRPPQGPVIEAIFEGLQAAYEALDEECPVHASSSYRYSDCLKSLIATFQFRRANLYRFELDGTQGGSSPRFTVRPV